MLQKKNQFGVGTWPQAYSCLSDLWYILDIDVFFIVFFYTLINIEIENEMDHFSINNFIASGMLFAF